MTCPRLKIHQPKASVRELWRKTAELARAKLKEAKNGS